jgi:hypothetical protein
MADYLATNTPRLKMTQTGPRGTHHMTFRVKPGTTPAAALVAVTPVIEAMLPLMTEGTAWNSAEFAAIDSDVFLPVDFTPIIHAPTGLNVLNTFPYGMYVNFVGRTAAGSRVAFYLFNVDRDYLTANNRLTPAENANVATVKTVMQANSAVLCGIDQNSFILKDYANTGINDAVAKRSRAFA